jgi:hypothetical protein
MIVSRLNKTPRGTRLHTAEVAARSHRQLVSPLRRNFRISFSPTQGK